MSVCARSLATVAGGLVLASCSYTPEAVENRTGLPSCGRYENENQPYTADQLEKNRCILAALAEGRPAELVVTLATVEGDPYTEYVRVLGRDRVEIFVDSTGDTEAGPEARWSRWLCRGLEETPAGYLERLHCREVPLDGPTRSGAPAAPSGDDRFRPGARSA